MKRALCKLCSTVIECTNSQDFFSCPCGEVTIDQAHGAFHAAIKTSVSNFICIDDEGNEIIPKYGDNFSWIDGASIVDPIEQNGISGEINIGSRRELLSIMDAMIINIDRMPQDAKYAPVTHSDFSELLTLIVALFRSS